MPTHKTTLILPAVAGLLLLTSGATRDATDAARALVPPADAGESLARATKTPHKKKSASALRERDAAERALAFLAEAAPAWDRQHNCYGCHVQAVAAMAFTTGEKHQYRVNRGARDHMVRALLDGTGGAHAPHPFTVSGTGSLPHAGAAFGGAALAALDEAEIGEPTTDLVKTARRLLGYQQPGGAVTNDDARPPVIPSDVATTYLATQTWRQAYARTADDVWLAPIRKAERYLHGKAARWSDEPSAEIQPINYALLGLLEAGVGASEPIPRALSRELLARQNDDGGWGFARGAGSNAFATGQTLYVLRRLGFDDGAKQVVRGTRWLIDHQNDNGGWGEGGAGKAEAMWGVMGLVSIDVLSIEVAGLLDGEHVEGDVKIGATASDNRGRGVRRVKMYVDDVLVRTAKGAALGYTWDVRGLEPGMHLVDFVAENAEGKESRRRVRVYAGDTFLTEVGSRFDGGETVFSLRNIAPERLHGKVELVVYEDAGEGKKGKRLSRSERQAVAGAHAIAWKQKGAAGKSLVAELTFADKSGKRRHTVTHNFVHEDPQAAFQRFGQLQGKIDFDDGVASANTLIELVDERGNVVTSTRSTRSGQWRFKNVKKGRYKVRVNKSGFKSQERDVDAAPAAEATLDLSLSSQE